jgi:hypothetical protein
MRSYPHKTEALQVQKDRNDQPHRSGCAAQAGFHVKLLFLWTNFYSHEIVKYRDGRSCKANEALGLSLFDRFFGGSLVVRTGVGDDQGARRAVL